MRIFSDVNIAESDSITETIESMEARIDRLKDRKGSGEESVMYRGKETDIDDAIRDLKSRIKSWKRLNED